MPVRPRYAAVLTLAVALIATGCKKPAADDATTTAAVRSRLSGDAALASEPIQSSVQTGIATLSGSVSSEAARSLAANDAAQVAGVRTVINNLTVQTAGADAAQNLAFPPSASAPAAAVNPEPERIPTTPAKPSARIERDRSAHDRSERDRAANREPNHPNQNAPEIVPQNSAQNLPTPAPIERPVQQAPPPQPSFRDVNIPAGTSIPVRITQTLDSATTQQGETFTGTVASDVLVDGLVAIPQGAAVSGRVDAVQEAAHFKGNSLLTIEVTSISRHGERIPVSTEAYSRQGASRGRNTAIKTGAGAAAGAILGGIFGGGQGAAIGAAAGGGTGAGINAVTRGQQVQIPSESLVPFRLSNSVSVRVSTRNTPRPEGDANGSQRRPLNPPQ